MPELPEMENYKRLLNQQLAGSIISDAQINREKSINVPSTRFIQEVNQKQIIKIERRAKHLIFRLNSGKSLLLHLMLGGWMYIGNEKDNPDRTKQVILSFGDRSLYFIGLRLGYLHLLDDTSIQQDLSDLGPEPLTPDFTFPVFQNLLKKKKGKLKTTLLNQQVISGIGNCYSDEICFEAKIKPTVTVDSLDEKKMITLHHSIQTVLQNAISLGGYMDPLFSGDQLTGRYSNQTLVYDREGENCKRCGETIVKIKISSRKCFFCPKCQTD